MSIESLMEKLCKNLALELLPKLIPEPITRSILETLIGLIDEEQKGNEQLRKLIGSYYTTGMEYLTDAKVVQEKRREEWIQKALERFVTASEVEDAILKAKSQFFVGVCYDLLNERVAAKRWYEKAYESAYQQLVRMKPPIVKVVGLKFLQGTAVVVGGVTGAIVGIASGGSAWAGNAIVGASLGNVMGKAPQDRERRKQQQQLEELRHFMNPLSQVLLAHGATFTHRLVDVESQFRAVAVAIGATKEQWNKDGLSRSYARQYQEAIADYDFALRLDPHYAIAYNNRGVAYFNLEEYQKAIADYDCAIQHDPGFALAYNNRGVAYFNLNEYQRATADFDQAIRLSPTKGSPYYVKMASVYSSRGNAYFNLKEYQRAMADFDQAIQFDHKNAALYNKRGVAYFNLEDYQRAIADFDRVIRLEPKVPLGYVNRGNAYFNLKEYQKAIADYNQLEHIYADIYFTRGVAYFNLREYQKAITDFDQAIRLEPKVPLGYVNRGNAYLNLKEYQKAIADYDQALQLDPKDVIAFRNRESAYEMINAKLRKSNLEGVDVKEANLTVAEVAQKQLEKDRPLQSATMHVEAGSPQQPKDAPQQPPQSVMYQFVPQSAANLGNTVRQPKNNLAITGLVFGIIAVLTSGLVVGLPFSIVGLVLAAMGMRRSGGKGMAIAGLVLSIIGVVVALSVIVLIILTFK